MVKALNREAFFVILSEAKLRLSGRSPRGQAFNLWFTYAYPAQADGPFNMTEGAADALTL